MLLVYNGFEVLGNKYDSMPILLPRIELYVVLISTRIITITVSFPSLNIPSLALEVKSYSPYLECFDQIREYSGQVYASNNPLLMSFYSLI